MLASTERTPLKVLTPSLAERLRVFNAAARELQRMGVRLHCVDPVSNRLTIAPPIRPKPIHPIVLAMSHVLVV